MDRIALTAALVAAACAHGTPRETEPDTEADTEAGTDIDTEADAPGLAEALDCGTLGSAGGLGAGTELQRLDLDLTAFPEARCNDGTAAFLYFRPAADAGSANRWAIQLQGGGSCGTAASCFARWCSVDTNFGMQGMTATESPAQGIRGRGVLARREDNPLGDFNHVFVRYCSSDMWAGSNDPTVTAPHPVTGEPVTAQIHFRGRDILLAALATLRQDGVAAPTYTLGGDAVPLPDLDEAETVVLLGASGGGYGTLLNADLVGELLRTHNPELAEYGAVIDSAFPPSFSHYDYADSVLCEQAGACDYEAHQRLEHEHPDGTSHLQGVADEASCAAFHASDGEAWRCADAHHVVSHHVTTPFLLRMGQRDTLLSSTMIDLDFAVDGEPLDLLTFARLVQADAAALADLDTHEEAEHTPRAPAVFIPTCADHEVLSDDAQVYETTIRVGEQDLAMFDVLAGWRLGTGPRVAIAADPSEDHCP